MGPAREKQREVQQVVPRIPYAYRNAPSLMKHAVPPGSVPRAGFGTTEKVEIPSAFCLCAIFF